MSTKRTPQPGRCPKCGSFLRPRIVAVRAGRWGDAGFEEDEGGKRLRHVAGYLPCNSPVCPRKEK